MLAWLCDYGQPGACPQVAPAATCRRAGASGRSGVSSLGRPSGGWTAFLSSRSPGPPYQPPGLGRCHVTHVT